jgi:hypothetical protein
MRGGRIEKHSSTIALRTDAKPDGRISQDHQTHAFTSEAPGKARLFALGFAHPYPSPLIFMFQRALLTFMVGLFFFPWWGGWQPQSNQSANVNAKSKTVVHSSNNSSATNNVQTKYGKVNANANSTAHSAINATSGNSITIIQN